MLQEEKRFEEQPTLAPISSWHDELVGKNMLVQHCPSRGSKQCFEHSFSRQLSQEEQNIEKFSESQSH